MIGHALVVWLVVWGWSAASPKLEAKKPSYVKATLIQLEEKAKPKPKPVKTITPAKQKPKKDDAKKRALAKKKQQEKKLAEQKRKKIEAERKNQLAKKKAAEKAAAEKKQKEQELQRKADLLKALEQERQQELQQSIDQEKARVKAEQAAAEDTVLAQSYNHIINARVTENWSRPPSARNNMVVLLRIQLIPTGDVVDVDVIKSSGDTAFDRSAIRAVKKAERFPELKKLPNHVFEKYFRTFNLLFEPKDLRQ
jgi:colicin import membrane protein